MFNNIYIYIYIYIYIPAKSRNIYQSFIKQIIRSFLRSVHWDLYVMFWPFDQAKMPFKVMHQEELTYSNGRYDIWHILMADMRGNRVGGNWLMKWDEVKKNPTHRKRVTSELHDSYFRLMTIKHSILKSRGRSSRRWTII